jgi:hypothetical protein
MVRFKITAFAGPGRSIDLCGKVTRPAALAD